MNTRQQKYPVLSSILAAAVLAGCGGGTEAADTAATPAAAASPAYILADAMNDGVMNASNVLWESVLLEDIAADGTETYSGPTSDEGWNTLRDAMQSLLDVSTQLKQMPAGWQVRDPSLEYEVPPGELAPAAIVELVNSQSGVWSAFSDVLRGTAERALQATQTRDLNTLGEISNSLDAVCESCHMQFWYPPSAAQ
ncbi:MAG: hypothetical protein LBE21_02275 [Pseudomonadales bacterium]|nr:hypothetical protein [Pseudomonadales bacterium]